MKLPTYRSGHPGWRKPTMSLALPALSPAHFQPQLVLVAVDPSAKSDSPWVQWAHVLSQKGSSSPRIQSNGHKLAGSQQKNAGMTRFSASHPMASFERKPQQSPKGTGHDPL